MQWNIGYPINRSAPLNRGLVSWWLRPPALVSNARWLDLCGKNHGTLVNGPIWSGAKVHPGSWGALDLDGVDDYVLISNVATVNFPITIFAWFRLNVSSGTQTLISHTSGTNNGYRFGNAASVLTFTLGGVSLYGFNTLGTVAANINYCAAVTVAGTTALGYLFTSNGVLTSESRTIGAMGGTPNEFTFSRMSSADNGHYVDGLLSDMRLYNRVLPADEITALYRASITGYKQELNWIEDDDILHSGASGKGGFLSFPLLIPVRYPRVMLL